MPKVGRKRKKTRTHVPPLEESSSTSLNTTLTVPKSMVVRHSPKSMSPEVSTLVSELRLLLAPYTALKLKERSKGRMEDYAAMAGPLGVTHVLAVSQNGPSVNLKVARAPAGPTLSFRVKEFSLGRDIKRLQRRPVSEGNR